MFTLGPLAAVNFTDVHLCAYARLACSVISNVKFGQFHCDSSFILPKRVNYYLVNSFSLQISFKCPSLILHFVREHTFSKTSRLHRSLNKNDIFKFNFLFFSLHLHTKQLLVATSTLRTRLFCQKRQSISRVFNLINILSLDQF